MALTPDDAIQIDYDEEADVLYVSFGPPQAALSFQLEDQVDVFLRYILPDPQVTGVFILDFLRNFPKSPEFSLIAHAFTVVGDLLKKYPKIPL